MILYTILPNELIFPFHSEEFSKQEIIHFNGVPLLVEQYDPKTIQVVRVLSSDPQHFLDERFLPGTKISLFDHMGLSSF